MRRTPRGRIRVSHDRWLVSYADFITLLFAFFATMYAISSVDARKFATVAHALQSAFDDRGAGRRTGHGDGVLPEPGDRVVARTGDSAADVQAAVMRDLASELDQDRLNLIVDRQTVTLSIPEAGTFSTGQDELSPEARDLVTAIAATLARFPNRVRVEGHTDDVPIRTVRFRSNWDLSASRASRVVEMFIERGLAPGRLSVAGYAEFQPRLQGGSAAARASNRRVDVVILSNRSSDDRSGPGGP